MTNVTTQRDRPGAGGTDVLFRDDAARAFVRDVSLTFGTRLVGIAAGAVTLTITTRLLGPEGRGRFAVVMTTVGLVLQIANLGLPTSAVYYLSRRPGLRAGATGLFVWVSIAGAGLVAFLAYGLAAWAPSVVPSVPLTLLAVALLGAPPALFLLLASNAFLGLGSARWFNVVDLGGKLAGVVAVSLLFWWPLTVVFAAYGALHYLLAALAYAQLVGRTRPALPERALAGDMLEYGFRAFLPTLVMFLVLRLDLFLVNALLGTTEAGRYSVAVQVAEILSLAAASIGAMLFPRLSSMPPGRRWATTRRVARATAALLALGGFGLILVGRPLFVGWFGLEFLSAVEALWWLLPGLWCLGVNTVFYQYLAASGMPWFLVGATSVAAVVNVMLNVKLIPAFGIVGAAGASSASYALLLASTLWYLWRDSLDDDPSPGIATPALRG